MSMTKINDKNQLQKNNYKKQLQKTMTMSMAKINYNVNDKNQKNKIAIETLCQSQVSFPINRLRQNNGRKVIRK